MLAVNQIVQQYRSPETVVAPDIRSRERVKIDNGSYHQCSVFIDSFIKSIFIYSRNINLKVTKMKKQSTVIKRIKSELNDNNNNNNNDNNNNNNNNALRNKGLTFKHKNILSWLDNDCFNRY